MEKFDIEKLFFEIAEYGSPKTSVVIKVTYDGLDLDFHKREGLFNGKIEVLKFRKEKRLI